MSGINFTIPGKPQPKERARRGKNGQWYTPFSTRIYEAKVVTMAKRAHVRSVIGPVEVSLDVYFPDKRRRDLDNVLKAVMDALNGVAYQDDSQIVRLKVVRLVDRDNPRVEVTINPGVGAG